MHLALIQQKASWDRADNLARGLASARAAAEAGAEVIAFAELAFERFLPQVRATEETLGRAETIPGPTTEAFAELAREFGAVLVLNLFEREGTKTFDSSPVLDADGSLLGTMRMLHITEYEGFHEQGFYAPGDRGVPVFETAHGRIGVAICYDRHYPEVLRALTLKGAELIVVPQAGSVGEWPEGLYEAEMRVASFQNGVFTALANRVGEEEQLTFAGESFVCDPSGRVVARAGRGTEETLHVTIDLAEIASSNAKRLFLRDRRPELYARWFAEETGG